MKKNHFRTFGAWVFLLRADSPSATWRLACFLCTAVQAPDGALTWTLPGLAHT